MARREFLHVLVDAVRADGATALLSSHVITDIEQACDRLLVLGAGRTLLDLSIAGAIAEHRVIDAGDGAAWAAAGAGVAAWDAAVASGADGEAVGTAVNSGAARAVAGAGAGVAARDGAAGPAAASGAAIVAGTSAVPGSGTLIGEFPGPAGERLRLVRGDATAGGRPATLEEVVLGHLAAGRPPRAAAATRVLAA